MEFQRYARKIKSRSTKKCQANWRNLLQNTGPVWGRGCITHPFGSFYAESEDVPIQRPDLATFSNKQWTLWCYGTAVQWEARVESQLLATLHFLWLVKLLDAMCCEWLILQNQVFSTTRPGCESSWSSSTLTILCTIFKSRAIRPYLLITVFLLENETKAGYGTIFLGLLATFWHVFQHLRLLRTTRSRLNNLKITSSQIRGSG